VTPHAPKRSFHRYRFETEGPKRMPGQRKISELLRRAERSEDRHGAIVASGLRAVSYCFRLSRVTSGETTGKGAALK
jgi:hypothetical protein